MEIAIPLTIVFVILRLTHVIDWSWWWVFSPLWIVAIISGIMYGVFGGIATISWLKEKRRETGRTWAPKVAGILSIIAGAMAIIHAMLGPTIVGMPFFLEETDLLTTVITIVLLIIFGSFAITGGILALKRKVWVLALTGAIASTFIFWPLGVPSIIMTAISKKEFGVKEATLPAQEETAPIILPPLKPSADTEQKSRRKRTINYCPECGVKVTKKTAYCPNCGNKLKNSNSW